MRDLLGFLVVEVVAPFTGKVCHRVKLGRLMAQVGVLVVAEFRHPIGQALEAVTQSHHAALQCRDGLCRLRVAQWQQSHLFSHVAQVDRVNRHAVNISETVLLQQNQAVALVVIPQFNLQVWNAVVHDVVFQCVD